MTSQSPLSIAARSVVRMITPAVERHHLLHREAVMHHHQLPEVGWIDYRMGMNGQSNMIDIYGCHGYHICRCSSREMEEGSFVWLVDKWNGDDAVDMGEGLGRTTKLRASA